MSQQQDFRKLQDDIVNSLAPDSPNSTGWRSCYCPVCQDTSRKTAGILIDDNSIALNCFRASCDANVTYEFNQPMSRKFKNLCKVLSVKIPPSLSLVKSNLQRQLESLDESLYVKNVYKDMEIPEYWVPLTPEVNSHWANYYRERRIGLDNVYYIRSGFRQGLTAIALRYFDKVIGFQVCNPDDVVRYRTISENSNLIAMQNPESNQAIVVEGLLDAYSIPNGVGILGNHISPEQAYHLRGKSVIMIPDRSGNKFIEQAKAYGWSVCIPPWQCNDVNRAVQQYGMMVVCRMIRESTYSNLKKAKVAYEQWRLRKDDKQ